jgi:hypothetical protein
VNRPSLIVGLALVAGGVASAGTIDDRPSTASKAAAVTIATMVADGKDVGRTVLIGPSAQIYEPDGEGAWTRHHEGGVAGDVTGAARVDGELVVAGHATPLYKAHGGTWFTLRLGEDGRTVMSQGPTAAVAIGKAVLVRSKVKGKSVWSRVGTLAGKPSALWADGTAVWASTDSALYRLRGGGFTKSGAAARALTGGTPWAITDKGLVDLDAGRTCPAELDGAAVTIAGAGGAPGADALTVVADTGAGLVLARTAKNGKSLERIDAVPATGAIAGVAVDGHDDVLIAFADGRFALRRGGSWTQGQVSDDLPKAKTGSRRSGPARTQ